MKRKNTLKNITGSLAALALCAVLPFMLSCWSDLDELHDMSQSKTYNLRDRGPAGGWIFHIVDNGDGTYTYYEAAPYGWHDGGEDPNITWGLDIDENEDNPTVPPELTGIGEGKANSQYIYDAHGPSGDDTLSNYPAFEACYNYKGGGYSDWFLPSRHELDMMCWNLHGKSHSSSDFHTARGEQEDNPDVPDPIGGFDTTDNYWSSSESESAANTAWGQDFDIGIQANYSKNVTYRVRAVRAF
jgi:hypothetical protein